MACCGQDIGECTEGGLRPQGKPNCLLGLCGSVASIKAEELVTSLQAYFTVVVVATESALRFVDLAALRKRCPVHTDADEWKMWQKKGDPVQHIDLRHWAHLFVLAPLSANTLAKLANGLCDNLVTCVARAWNPERPLVLAPAMNTLMWTHPFTARHLRTLRELGYVHEISPISKQLACGDVGVGAMAEPLTIAAECWRIFCSSDTPTPVSVLSSSSSSEDTAISSSPSTPSASSTLSSSSPPALPSSCSPPSCKRAKTSEGTPSQLVKGEV